MIALQQLVKRYADTTVVDGISLEIERGECVFLVGGSGCGKTTTLKMVNRLVEPTSGRVLLDGSDTRESEPHALRRRMGYVFQEVGLFPHLSVEDNIAVTPQLLGWSPGRIQARVTELLQQVELVAEDFRERMPQQLSGGQQQRVGLARALAAEPEVLLLDEPFGALDPVTRDLLQRSFRRIAVELELTSIFVTHDMAEALLLADRIAVMQEGRLVQVGTPRELLARPAHSYVAELLDTPRRQTEALEELLGEPPV